MERGERERERKGESERARERERETHTGTRFTSVFKGLFHHERLKKIALFCVWCFPDLCISWQDEFAKLIDEDDLHSRMTLAI